MTDARFYVYTLTDPRDGVVFYVGKGTGYRRHAHLADARAGRVNNAEKFDRICDILSDGLKPIAEIVSDGLAEDEAFAQERALIARIGWYNLTNIQPGGSTSPKDRAIAWANARLSAVKPFAQWVVERPRSACDLALYIRVIEELRAIAAGNREFRIVGPEFEVSC
jgi:hypothetical protein